MKLVFFKAKKFILITQTSNLRNVANRGLKKYKQYHTSPKIKELKDEKTSIPPTNNSLQQAIRIQDTLQIHQQRRRKAENALIDCIYFNKLKITFSNYQTFLKCYHLIDYSF